METRSRRDLWYRISSITSVSGSGMLAWSRQTKLYQDATRAKQPATGSAIHRQPWLRAIYQFLLYTATFGLPPRYASRFDASVDAYVSGHQPSLWRAFIEQVQREKVNANVIVSERNTSHRLVD
jgi:hypothetical protein